MVLLIVGFLFILFSYFFRNKYNAYWGLLFILVIMGFQYNVRGDYYAYEQLFNQLALRNIDASELIVEKGWIYLNLLFSETSFGFLVFSISFFIYWVLAKFINLYAEQHYKYVAGLIFFFSLNMMLFQMKGMRQAISIELSLLALMVMNERKTMFSILLSAIACCFHTSALISVPLIFLYKILHGSSFVNEVYKIKDFTLPLIITSAYFILFSVKSVFLGKMQAVLINLDLMGYEGYFGSIRDVSYHFLITLYGAIMVFATSYYIKYAIGFKKYIALISLLSLFIEMFLFGLGSLFRLNLYFAIYTIVVIPNTANLLKIKGYSLFAKSLIVLSVAYAFRTFITMTLRGAENGFDNYKFIFE